MNRPDRARRAALITLLLLAVLGLAAGPAAGQVVKLATLVPEGSVWDKALKQMGADWQAATEGRVKLRIYPGGVAGDEPDIVRKMRIGQLQAATLTTTGLTEIDDAFAVFEVPMLLGSYDELFHVLERLDPILRQRLAAKGFVLLNWGHGGWVRLFSKQPVRTVDDLRQLKVFVWAGNEVQLGWLKDNGFKPVPLAATDILTGLQSGLIEALPTTPLAALAFQWFRLTPYMLDLGFAPVVGATIVSQRAWEGIAEADRARLLEHARQVEVRLAAEIPRQDDESVAAMGERGLTVIRVEGTPGAAAWRSETERFSASLRRSDLIPGQVFDLAVEARDGFRRQGRGSGGNTP